MLGLQGGLDADGVPTIDGVRWDDPAALAAVRAVTAPDAELVYFDGDGPQRFDVLPISVATDGGVAAVGVDGGASARTSTSTASRVWPSASGSAASSASAKRCSASARCAAAA